MLHPTLRSVLGSRKLRSQSQDLGDLDGWINRNRYQESHVQLVGGFNASEKYESIGIIIPNLWKNMFQTTNQYFTTCNNAILKT
jgi:hypothetical protein